MNSTTISQNSGSSVGRLDLSRSGGNAPAGKGPDGATCGLASYRPCDGRRRSRVRRVRRVRRMWRRRDGVDHRPHRHADRADQQVHVDRLGEEAGAAGLAALLLVAAHGVGGQGDDRRLQALLPQQRAAV